MENGHRWWKAFGSSGPVALFHVDLAGHSGHESIARQWLSDDERRRRRRFRYSGPARQYSLCRASLRAVLCSELGCENGDLTLGVSEYGKPFPLVRGVRVPVEFNISHSGAHGLLALSHEGRVGVDVEERRLRKNLDGLVESVFGPEERAILDGLGGTKWLDTFLLFWTVKEALAKAWGMGLRIDFSRFQTPRTIRRGAPVGVFRSPRLSNAAWRVEKVGNRDLAAAVAYEIDTASYDQPVEKGGEICRPA